MTPDRRDVVKSVFCQALELPESERSDFLTRALDNPAERSEVETLLRWYSADYLTTPAVSPEMEEEIEGEHASPEQFGPYAIVRELGRGGMGTVYLAERHDELAGFPVALKVIAASEETSDLEARLRVEMQVLTKLQHGHIVAVHDAGISTQGRLYLSMEYVEGLRLDVFCRQNGLKTRDRLRLFLGICDAVAHAHRHLIIHRDLKPSNILVTADGTPKLVDFGLAKILGNDSEALATSGQWRLSLRYASPEQIRNGSLTTATDIYSLGVILHELVTGTSPYGPDTDPVNLMQAVLSRNPIKPPGGAPGFDLDLESIVLRALRKEPQARYGSVDELRQDIDRYLRGLPVAARRGNATYVTGKFIRRHVTTVAAGLVICGLLVAAGVSQYQAVRSNRELDRALVLAGDLSMSLNAGTDPARRGKLVIMAREVGDLLLSQARRRGLTPLAQSQIAEKLVALSSVLGHPSSAVNLGDVGSGVQLLRSAVGISEELYAKYPDDQAVAAGASRTCRCLGTLLIEEGDYESAARLFRRSSLIDLRRCERWPQDPMALADYGDSLADLSRISFHERKAEECLRLGKESIEFRRKAAAASPENLSLRFDIGHGLSNYCFDLTSFGQYREALANCQESNKVLSDNMSYATARRETARLIAENLDLLGQGHAASGDSEGAIRDIQEGVRQLRQLREAVPLDTSNEHHLAMSLSHLAVAQFQSGRRAAARNTAREALQLAAEAATADPANAKDRQALDDVRERMQPILLAGRQTLLHD